MAGMLSVVWLLLSIPAWASDIQAKPVRFKKDESTSTIRAELRGRQTIDYSLRARVGQTMSVTFSSSNRSAYFNVMPPDSTREAIFVGSTEGDVWAGVLPSDGEYKIRTYLYRNAARRNERAKFTLAISVADTALGSASPSDAKVKGTPYHATGTVPCSAGGETARSKQCNFGVIRGAPGNAEVHLIYFSIYQHKRVLTFMGDRVSADNNGTVNASKRDDLWSIEVNSFERYQIPEAVINGG
jgi:hypothetical protein